MTIQNMISHIIEFPALKSDLNSDGILTPADAAIALRLTPGQPPVRPHGARAHADVSGDDRVTSLDVLMILQAAADNIDL